MTTPIMYDSLIIALGVVIPAGILAGPRLYKWCKAKKEAKTAADRRRLELEEKRDGMLSEMRAMLIDIGGDVRCLYESQPAKLDALEVSLRALHGEKINGNVSDALDRIQEARDKINARMVGKMGCGDIGAGVD